MCCRYTVGPSDHSINPIVTIKIAIVKVSSNHLYANLTKEQFLFEINGGIGTMYIIYTGTVFRIKHALHYAT